MRSSCLLLLSLGASFSHANTGIFRPPFEEEGCGHKSSMTKAWAHGLLPNMTRGSQREALPDTDVINNAISIEIAPPSTQIVGSNMFSVVSKKVNLTEFTFRLSDSFTIGTVTLDGRPITLTRLDASTVKAVFDRPYALNEPFSLYVPYSGPAVSAFFGSFYTGTRTSGAGYAYSLSEPWYAYTWWPNKDDNTDKSTFDIHITCPNTMKAVSNGLLQGTDTIIGGKSRYRWRTNYPMAPYLCSIAVTTYNTWTQTYTFPGGTMPVQYWIWPESDTTANRNAWGLVMGMFPVFGNIFGLYPFRNEKYGIYHFNFSGGMEHQTCTGMGTFSESVNAHELAHHWWGDDITCATWQDIWLNEGFATYSEALWYERKSGGTFAAYKTAMNNRKPAQTSDSVYCYNISDPNRIFSSTYSYRKGAWVLHMLRGIVGEQTLFNILAEYRARYSGKTATTDQFIQFCEDVYGQDLSYFFDKFVYSGGAPIYQWAWTPRVVNGKNFVEIYIKQTQNASLGTFTLPIDIRPTVGGVKQLKRVMNKSIEGNYLIPLNGPATACTFDEDVWTLNGGVTTTSFVAGGPIITGIKSEFKANARAEPQKIQVTFHVPVTTSASDYTIYDPKSAANVPFTFSYNAPTQTTTLILNPRKPLETDLLILTARDTITSTANGKRLDGDQNGTPGGDFVSKLSIR